MKNYTGSLSDCCGASVIMTDICSSCREHCDSIPEQEVDETAPDTQKGTAPDTQKGTAPDTQKWTAPDTQKGTAPDTQKWTAPDTQKEEETS